MASVTSLDKDLRRVRLEKFTPAAANEVRDWIEEVLGERLSSGDLLESLKDGVALCKYVLPPSAPPPLSPPIAAHQHTEPRGGFIGRR